MDDDDEDDGNFEELHFNPIKDHPISLDVDDAIGEAFNRERHHLSHIRLPGTSMASSNFKTEILLNIDSQQLL